MSNHAVLDKSLGHLTYAEQRNVVKKLAKLEKDERFLKDILNKHMTLAKRDGLIPKNFNMKDYYGMAFKRALTKFRRSVTGSPRLRLAEETGAFMEVYNYETFYWKTLLWNE